ncbi:MAG: glycosyltransferase family 39 protein [Bacteroidota bacterium]
MKSLPTYAYWGLFLALFAQRLFHLGPHLDLPHDWRQADTAFYIFDFYQNGTDLLYPSVCWMGGYGTVIFEFALPEAIVAFFYGWFGESLLVARLVFLAFYGGCLFFFYRIVELWYGRELARLASLVYLGLPLSFFYSRAIHVDFSALCFAYGMLYCFLRGVKERKGWWMVLSGLMAIPACLIKVPYAFYLALPMLVFAWREGALGWALRHGWAYVAPVGLFWLWQQHVYAFNGQAPDWDYLLHYRKFNVNNSWYFGDWAQRLRPYSWKVLGSRVILEVAGIGGVLWAAIGLWRFRKDKQSIYLYAWLLGTLIYVLIFFNLNFVHNYYQLPLLAPTALLTAAGLRSLWQQKQKQLLVALLLSLAVNWFYAEYSYYELPHQLIEAGQQIEAQTDERAKVVVTYRDFDCRNPRILYRARRRGWSLEEKGLQPEVVERLRGEEGATHWIYIGQELPSQMKSYLDVQKSTPFIHQLESGSDRLFIFRL